MIILDGLMRVWKGVRRLWLFEIMLIMIFLVLLVSWIGSDISLRKIQVLVHKLLRAWTRKGAVSCEPLEKKVYHICCE